MASIVEYAQMIGLLVIAAQPGIENTAKKAREQFKRLGDALGPQSYLNQMNPAPTPADTAKTVNIAA